MKAIGIFIAGFIIGITIVIITFPNHMPSRFSKQTEMIPHPITLEDIVNTGEMTVITYNNAHCFYMYRDESMGFEYDLINEFANYLGVNLKIKLATQWDDIINDISRGEGAIAAAGLTITPSRKKNLAFSDGYMTIRQHLITRRKFPEIRSHWDLAGKTVHVKKGTPYHEMLHMLISKGIPINLVVDDTSTEDLIRQVAEGAIDITVANSNIALLTRRYYPEIQISAPISDEQELGWALSHSSEKLKDRINHFFRTIKKNGKYNEIYNKYYANIENYNYGDIQDFHEQLSTKLPLYIDWIREEAEANGIDWRLIAAIIYQESRYNPKTCSPSGACGLMQLTQTTARMFQVTDIFDPQQNIIAGIQHFKELYDLFDKAEGTDRVYLALAAYNAGQGHVMDARNLAREMNLDPDKWSSLSKTLLLLSNQKYYQKAVYGYCRGYETVEYIHKVKDYYDILKQLHVNEKSE